MTSGVAVSKYTGAFVQNLSKYCFLFLLPPYRTVVGRISINHNVASYKDL